MKIIDLLNKIANGEEVPKRIKINNVIYEYRGYMYCTEKANYQDIEDYLFGKWNFNILNQEIEILEEEKKIPEKLKWNEKSQYNVATDNTKKTLERLLSRSEQLKKSINQIVDYLNYLKSKGE